MTDAITAARTPPLALSLEIARAIQGTAPSAATTPAHAGTATAEAAPMP